ncbi:hypothetical protein HRV97_00650 [Sphingomonas sp. HHU CXW]|uniref:Uncharacterized protein n=1 Tax=Sphingomonas hominis TaxID=2741495 RepID=A0ABX2JC16_9SPHN|nr:hypothetical protein [Sphingomonas hominis]NTS63665.1 hypothetical protein [Sphingomonas hominis]
MSALPCLGPNDEPPPLAQPGNPTGNPLGTAAERAMLQAEAHVHVARATTMLRRARALVAADRAHRIALLTRQRERLFADLAHFQRFKHTRIFDPVVRHGSASAKVVARTMKVDCFHLGETVASYHARWRYLDRAEWASYRADMLATADLLHARMQAELRAIDQLLTISHFYAPRA